MKGPDGRSTSESGNQSASGSNGSTTRGLLVGRFQPFHGGHRRIVGEIAATVDEVIVGIGSADRSHTVENPFTASERTMMISKSLADVDVMTYTVPIEDLDRNAVWVGHVTSLCPSFEMVYTNNPLVERLFAERGFTVRGTPLYDREAYRGTEIRRRMIANEDWSHLVPRPVRAVIDEIDGVDRLRRVAWDAR